MDDPAKIVEDYLRVHMIPDPATARKLYCAPEMEIRFTGNRLMHDPAEATAFNKSRYKWVKKSSGVSTTDIADYVGLGISCAWSLHDPITN
jgi:hypothetical protein